MIQDDQRTAPPSLSVVICAYTLQRWQALCNAVASALDQQPAPDQVIVVIDHNEELLDRAVATFGDRTRIIPNRSTQGLSGARNTGTEAASGTVVAFLDDDATAEPGWAATIRSWFTRPEVVGLGGSAEPQWPDARPAWFPEEFDWVVGCTYRGMPETAAPVRNPIGCNMAFRRSAILEAGGFDSSIGRLGTIPLGCEETELSIRLHMRSPTSKIMYDPRARIEHHVAAPRTRFRYFVSRCWGEGLSKAAVRDRVGAGAALASERSYVTRVLPAAVIHGLASPPSGWGRAAAILVGLATTTLGYGVGLYQTSLRRTAG